MRIFITFLFSLILITELFSSPVVVKNDNGNPAGNSYSVTRRFWEESCVLQPDGPCNVLSVQIYYSGTEATLDTIWICGFPTAGNLWPTQYVWPYNSLIPPIEIQYDGIPGWKEIDVSKTGLRSDGYDKIVIQHRMKPKGPWFTYDDGTRRPMPSSWMTDPFSPNPNFYNAVGTIYAYPPGNYMLRLMVEYDYPDGETSMPPPPPTFVDVTSAAGLSGGGYVSVVDWNKDGYDDLAIGSNFFQNKGDGTFENLTSKFNIIASGTTWGDFDNDGDIDVYAMRNGSQDLEKHMVYSSDRMYRNNGDGTFSPINPKDIFTPPYPHPKNDFGLSIDFAQDSMPNPYPLITPVFFDYNNDGWLDLFMANRRIEVSGEEVWCPDQLWKNNGDGTFTNVRESSKIALGEPKEWANGFYDCYGAAVSDFNNDGKQDIFVANYRLIKDNLYMNNGDGTFTDVGASTGTQGITTPIPYYFGHGMGCQWGDFNNDTYPDLCVGNLAHTYYQGSYSNPSLIFRNNGPEEYFTFTNMQPTMVLKFHEGNAGVCWLDMDLDGYLDIWHGKYSGGFGSFYLNTGPPVYKLREITWELGAIVDNSWTAVRLDYDNDGDLDMVINGRLFRNDMQRKGNWIAFRFNGNPENGINYDCYGTKVIVKFANKNFTRELSSSAAGSLCTQNSNELHFGLGDGEPDIVEVYTPDGYYQSYNRNFEKNRRYLIDLRNGKISQNGISTPALKYPKNYQVKLSVGFDFEWYESGGAKYYIVELSDNKNFISGEQGFSASYKVNSGTKMNISTLNDNTTFFWRVKAFTDSDSSQWSSVWTFTTGLAMPSAPELISPMNDTTNVKTKPQFSWKEVFYNCLYCSKTTYNLQIAEDDQFQNIVLNYDKINPTFFTINDYLEPATQYYWRVRAFNYELPGPWSQTYKFKTIQLAPAPSQINPTNQEMNVIIKPKFEWKLVPNAMEYHLQVSKYDDFSEIAFERENMVSDNFKMIKSLDYETKYFWRIRSFNDAGYGSWSSTWEFTTLKSSSVEIEFEEFDKFHLFENSPNPFNEKTIISFFVSEFKPIKIGIYDFIGREIEVLFDGFSKKGINTFEWNAKNHENGIYFYRIFLDYKIETGSMMLIK